MFESNSNCNNIQIIQNNSWFYVVNLYLTEFCFGVVESGVGMKSCYRVSFSISGLSNQLKL